MPLHGYCSDTLLAVKVGTVEDGAWFPAGTGGSTKASCSSVSEFWVLGLESCNDASAGDGVASADNTRGVMESTGGRGASFVVMSAGPVSTIFLGTMSCPACAKIGGFDVVLAVIVVAAAATVV